MRSLSFHGYLLVLVAVNGGCSDGSASTSDASGGAPGTNDVVSGGIELHASSGVTSTSGSDGPTVEVDASAGSCGGLKVTDGCVGEVFEGEGIPLDIQIIFDQSGSMATVIDEQTGETRFDAVYRAVEAFVSDNDSMGLGVGLSFFGYQPIGQTSCDPDDYDSAAVAIAPLPDNADRLLGSLKAAQPTGETPTAAAIQGGCRLSNASRDEHPGRAVVNLLVTDGEPRAPVTSKTTDCQPTLVDAVAAAQSCFDAGAGIATYVLGVGPALDNLNQIASAGGSERAYLVANDSSSGVLAALNQVRSAASIPCELTIDGGSPDLHFEEASVVMLDQSCELMRFARVDSAQSCQAGGFYFDDTQQPSSILLCDASCDQVKQTGSKLLYSIGCGIEEIK